MLLALILGASPLHAQEPVSFTTSDGITVYGDFYAGPDAAGPVILAFHQADFNRLEYREIAPRLVKDGFSVLAIDQRSGGDYGGEVNRTAKESKAFWVYTDALPDLEAALSLFELPRERLTLRFSECERTLGGEHAEVGLGDADQKLLPRCLVVGRG